MEPPTWTTRKYDVTKKILEVRAGRSAAPNLESACATSPQRNDRHNNECIHDSLVNLTLPFDCRSPSRLYLIKLAEAYKWTILNLHFTVSICGEILFLLLHIFPQIKKCGYGFIERKIFKKKISFCGLRFPFTPLILENSSHSYRCKNEIIEKKCDTETDIGRYAKKFDEIFFFLISLTVIFRSRLWVYASGKRKSCPHFERNCLHYVWEKCGPVVADMVPKGGKWRIFALLTKKKIIFQKINHFVLKNLRHLHWLTKLCTVGNKSISTP